MLNIHESYDPSYNPNKKGFLPHLDITNNLDASINSSILNIT